MSCVNCAYSLEDKTNECMECDICFRNAKLVSRKFTPVQYKDLTIACPIDMFISKEHKKLIDEEIKKMYEEGVRRGIPIGDSNRWWSGAGGFDYPMNLLKIDNMKISCDSNSTLTLTWTMTIIGEEPIKENDLKIADKLGQIIEEKKQVSKGKIVSIDITDILKDMEGMEIGEDQ